MDNVRGADPHALAALYAAAEKVTFGEGAGGSDDRCLSRGPGIYDALHYGKGHSADEGGFDEPAAVDINWDMDGTVLPGQAEMDGTFRAVLDAVHADMTFSDPQFALGIASSVTVAKTFLAISALFDITPDSEQ